MHLRQLIRAINLETLLQLLAIKTTPPAYTRYLLCEDDNSRIGWLSHNYISCMRRRGHDAGIAVDLLSSWPAVRPPTPLQCLTRLTLAHPGSQRALEKHLRRLLPRLPRYNRHYCTSKQQPGRCTMPGCKPMKHARGHLSNFCPIGEYPYALLDRNPVTSGLFRGAGRSHVFIHRADLVESVTSTQR